MGKTAFCYSSSRQKDVLLTLAAQILQILAGREDTWYPTNIQLRDYVAAYESLIFSADGNLIYNPTLQEIWLNVDGTGHSIKPGETLTLV